MFVECEAGTSDVAIGCLINYSPNRQEALESEIESSSTETQNPSFCHFVGQDGQDGWRSSMH